MLYFQHEHLVDMTGKVSDLQPAERARDVSNANLSVVGHV